MTRLDDLKEHIPTSTQTRAGFLPVAAIVPLIYLIGFIGAVGTIILAFDKVVLLVGLVGVIGLLYARGGDIDTNALFLIAIVGFGSVFVTSFATTVDLGLGSVTGETEPHTATLSGSVDEVETGFLPGSTAFAPGTFRATDLEICNADQQFPVDLQGGVIVQGVYNCTASDSPASCNWETGDTVTLNEGTIAEIYRSTRGYVEARGVGISQQNPGNKSEFFDLVSDDVQKRTSKIALEGPKLWDPSACEQYGREDENCNEFQSCMTINNSGYVYATQNVEAPSSHDIKYHLLVPREPTALEKLTQFAKEGTSTVAAGAIGGLAYGPWGAVGFSAIPHLFNVVDQGEYRVAASSSREMRIQNPNINITVVFGLIGLLGSLLLWARGISPKAAAGSLAGVI